MNSRVSGPTTNATGDFGECQRLLSAGIVEPEALTRAQALVDERGGELIDVLLRHGLADEQALLRFVVGTTRRQFVSSDQLRGMSLGSEVLDRLSAAHAEALCVLPLKLDAGADELVVATADFDAALLDSVREAAGVLAVRPVAALRPVIRAAIKRFYFSDLWAFDALQESEDEPVPPPRHERTCIMGMPQPPERAAAAEDDGPVPPPRHERTCIMGMPQPPERVAAAEEEKPIDAPPPHERTQIMGMPKPPPSRVETARRDGLVEAPPRHERTQIMGVPKAPAAPEGPGAQASQKVHAQQAAPVITRFPAPKAPAPAEPPRAQFSSTSLQAPASEALSLVALRFELRPPALEQRTSRVGELLAARNGIVRRAVALISESSGWLQKAGPEGLTFLWDLQKSPDAANLAVQAALRLVREARAANERSATLELPPLIPVAAVAAGIALVELVPRGIRLSGDPIDESTQLALRSTQGGVFVTEELVPLLGHSFRFEPRPCTAGGTVHEVLGPRTT